jgi:hypothetical protein
MLKEAGSRSKRDLNTTDVTNEITASDVLPDLAMPCNDALSGSIVNAVGAIVR